MSAGSVVTGNPRSAVWEIRWSSPTTVSSEQTARNLNGCEALPVHSLRVWSSREREGRRTRVRSAFSLSMTQRATRVLPVPQAMMSWPRSWVANAWHTSSSASS